MELTPAAPGRARTWSRVALAAGAIWAAGLVAAGLLVPMGTTSTASSSSDGTVREVTTATTLVESDGVGVLVVLGLPLLATAAVAVLLGRGERRGAAVSVAWIVVGLCAALTVLGALSIGILVLPVTVALAVAVALHRCAAGSDPHVDRE